MITSQELNQLRTEWGLGTHTIEKDYVLGWVLAAIANEPALAASWVFKGGTCLRKCYYETYRFSEDLDFTIVDSGPESPEDLKPIFEHASGWLYDQSGIQLVVDDTVFTRQRNRRGNPTTKGRLPYRGPSGPPSVPKLNLDLTSDELLAERPVVRPVGHAYSDKSLPMDGVSCYSIVELFAEKLRALAQRCRPRDLYDVVYMHRHPDLTGRSAEVRSLLARKCAFVGIEAPTLESIRATEYRAEIEEQWVNMLGHQLPQPTPSFDDFWSELNNVFGWLEGSRPIVLPPRIERADIDPDRLVPLAMTSWRRGFPLELIRYSGANRLRVEIDYRAEDGRSGARIVEPYSLRYTNDGNLVLFVVNDRGQLRSYRVDRIAGVRPTNQTFVPRYFIEF